MTEAEAVEAARQVSRCIDTREFVRAWREMGGPNMPAGLARAWAIQLAQTGASCSV